MEKENEVPESGITLSPLSPDKLQGVLEIERSVYSLPWTRDMFLSELAFPEQSFFYVMELEGALIGYAGFRAFMGEAHIMNIAVHPRHMRKGLGKKLLDFLLGEIAAQRAGIVYLEVRRSNAAAIGLYERSGFTTVSVRPGYYADNCEDALIMVKGLDIHEQQI